MMIEFVSPPQTSSSSLPEETEGLELVDELVDDVPEPLVGEFPVDRPVVVENEVEEAAVVVVGLVSVLESRSVGHAGVNVTEVQLLVQDQEEWVVLTWNGKMRRGKGGKRGKGIWGGDEGKTENVSITCPLPRR